MSSAKEEFAGSMNSEAKTSSSGRFTDLCKTLNISKEVMSEATSLLNEIKSILLASSFGGRGPEETEIYCYAFILYCAIKLKDDLSTEDDKQGRTRLSDILRATNLKLDDFFKEAQQFIIKAKQIFGDRYGFDWEDRLELKQLEKIVRMLNDARKFFDKTFGDFFSFGSIGQSSSTSGISKEIHRFGWLLFLTLRIDTPDLFKDLVSCVHGLVAVLAILILHVPVKFRNFSPQDTSRLVKRSEKGVDLLASLCNTYHTFEDCLRGMMEKAYKIISETLNQKPVLASDCKTELMNHINTEGLMYFNNMLEEGAVGPGIQALEKHYMDVVGSKGEIDEMLFVQSEDKLSVGTSNLCDSKSKFETLASPTKTMTHMLTIPLSPMSPAKPNFITSNPKILQMTPVTSAMTTAKWLREVISPLPDKPSPHLEQFLSLPDNKSLTSDLMRRAHIILEAIFHNGNSFDISWAKERKFEASKLYYRVLESICRSESNLPSSKNENNNGNTNNLAQLLSNERFHRCMLACSAELVLATHKTVLMMFPAVLEATGLTPFDLSKVIESFVRHEETLPRELKRHLNSLEEQLLESMVWGKGSSLYNSLLVARPDLGPEISRLGLLAEPMLSLDEIAARHNVPVSGALPVSNRKRDASPDQGGSEEPSPKRACIQSGSLLLERNCFTPPAKERLYSLKSKFHPLQSTFASPTQTNPIGGNETCAEIGCKVFFSKILKLSAIRIRSLCERLRQPQQILDRVYGIFQQILDKQTHLLFNRHVDQIILCCFYGVAKVSRLNLTFKEIVSSYKREPQCKSEVFRNVFVSHSSNLRVGISHVDVITFYNEVFVPAVKPLLVGMVPSASRTEEKTNAEGVQIPGSPKVSPFSNLPDMSPKKVSASHNVYVSPLRQSKMDALLSPSSRSYYACIGESTHAFQSPSKDLDAINSRLNSTGRRLITGRINFDMVSDSVVAGSLGYQNGSSASSDSVAPFGLPVKREQAETDQTR